MSLINPRKVPGFALVTAIIISAVFFFLLTILFTYSGFVQAQTVKDTRVSQAVALGNAGLNRALASYRLNPSYSGTLYTDMVTGEIETYITTSTTDATKKIITAQSYVPDRRNPQHVCRSFKAVMDPTTIPPSFVRQTYQERTDCATITYPPNTPPTLQIVRPDIPDEPVTIGSTYSVKYKLFDSDSNVTAHFFYDTDNSGFDGKPLDGPCSDAPEGANDQDAQYCSWRIPDTLTVNQSYFIWGKVFDGTSEVKVYSQGSLKIVSPPQFSISRPNNDRVNSGQSFAIVYSLNDSDSQVTAALYYETDGDSRNGTAIAGCGSVPEGINATCTWNTSGVPNGSYWVYGTANDGTNPVVTAQSPGQLIIGNGPILEVLDPAQPTVVAPGDTYRINYKLSDPNDVVTAALSYDNDTSNTNGTGSAISGCTALPESALGTCTWNTTGVAEGTYYIYGVSSDGATTATDYSPSWIQIKTPGGGGGGGENLPPWLAITQPDGVNDSVATGTVYDIKYKLYDPDSIVTAQFFYSSTQGDQTQGVAITGPCASAPETGGVEQACSWNTSSVPAGTYWVFGLTRDTASTTSVISWSLGPITITSANIPPKLTISNPDSINDTFPSGSAGPAPIIYTMTDPDSTATVTFYYLDSQGKDKQDGNPKVACIGGEGTNTTCNWPLGLVRDGDYRIWGIARDGSNSVGAISPGYFTKGSTPPPPPPAACDDGQDNDNDSKVDWPSDIGCWSSSDTDETDPPDNDSLNALIQDVNGNIYAAGYQSVTDTDLVVRKYSSNGVVASGFGTNGSAIYTNEAKDAQANAVAVDTLGHIYAVGSQRASGSILREWLIVRFTSSGALDTSWGNNGVITYTPGFADEATALAINHNNDIFVAGTISAYTPGSKWAIRKYNVNGDLCDGKNTCSGWGEREVPNLLTSPSKGMVTFAPTTGYTVNRPTTLLLDNNNSLYVTGNHEDLTTYSLYPYISLIKYTSVGGLDGAFGTNGVVTYNPGSAEVSAMASDGSSVYLSGFYVKDGANGKDWFIRKYGMSNGALDTTFNGSGMQTYHYNLNDTATSVSRGLLDYCPPPPDNGQFRCLGSILANLYVGGQANSGWTIRKYELNGALDDRGWGTNPGTNRGTVIGPNGSLSGITTYDDGSIVAGGNGYATGDTDLDWVLRKYKPNGQPETTFGTNGEVYFDSR